MKLLVGIITKPQGIKGEIKLKDLTDGQEATKNLKEVFIDGVAYKILNMRYSGEDLFLSLRGIADRNMAETFRGKEVYADKDQISKEEGTFFIVDVLGCTVVTDKGEEIGKVVDITSSRTDVYYVQGEKGTAVFPMIKDLSPIFDIENKMITVNAERLAEIVFYEN
jgi:16S rRNA processing protein RimM